MCYTISSEETREFGKILRYRQNKEKRGERLMIKFWLIALVVFAAVEAITVGLTSIWFALGSLVALFAAMLGAQLWLQIALFVVVSGITLAFTRPLAVKYLNNRRQATNADRVLEMVGVVIEDVDNVAATGVVKVDGKEWSARSMSGVRIEKGTLVRPMMIDGVKLIVVPAQERAEVLK